MVSLPYHDRHDAGRQLADALSEFSDRDDVLVLALPRGGVPVAYEVARALHAPLDLMLVRKLGMPGHEELAIGAIATGGAIVLNRQLLDAAALDQQTIDQIAARERTELHRRAAAYRGDRPEPDLRDKTVIVIDDGLATGSTMLAAVAALRQQNPARIVVAVPVAPPETIQAMRTEVDRIVCPATPASFGAVGRWFENFQQTTDDEVRDLLKEHQPS